MTELNTIADLYLQIGILGLCAILVVYQVWHNYKTNKSREESNFTNNQKNMQDMFTLLKEQNWDYQKQQQELLDKILNSVSKPHIPSKEESEKVSKISNKINQILKDILNNTQSDRAILLQYHNGGMGMNGQSFLKMSITNEQIKLGVKPVMMQIKDQFRTSFSHLVETLDNSVEVQSLMNCDILKEKDVHSYEFLKSIGVFSMFGVSLRDNNNTPIGILLVTYSNKEFIKEKEAKEELSKSKISLEILLNL